MWLTFHKIAFRVKHCCCEEYQPIKEVNVNEEIKSAIKYRD